MPPRLAHALDRFTSTFLGYTFPAPQFALDHARFSPDSPSAYCPRCGDSVGPGEFSNNSCATCRPGAELAGGLADHVLRLSTYTDPMMSWVRDIKFRGWDQMADHLGRLLARQLLALDPPAFFPTHALVVPMPMPALRRLYRGIDHTRLLASALADHLHAPLASPLARRLTAPQTSLPPSLRRHTSGHSFFLRRSAHRRDFSNLHIILVDDVRTTGASLRAAVRLLRTLKPAKIIAAVLAVSDSRARLLRRDTRSHEPRPSGIRG